MLVLNRKAGEAIVVGQDIWVTVLEVRGNRVKLGFECPAEVSIHRRELAERITETASPPASQRMPGADRVAGS